MAPNTPSGMPWTTGMGAASSRPRVHPQGQSWVRRARSFFRTAPQSGQRCEGLSLPLGAHGSKLNAILAVGLAEYGFSGTDERDLVSAAVAAATVNWVTQASFEPPLVVVDSQLQTPPTARLFEPARPVWIYAAVRPGTDEALHGAVVAVVDVFDELLAEPRRRAGGRPPHEGESMKRTLLVLAAGLFAGFVGAAAVVSAERALDLAPFAGED